MKTVVITGATSGIGLESAKLLARQGFRVLGVGRDRERCRQALEQVEKASAPGRAEFFTADLLQQREVIRLAGELEGRLRETAEGELFALINNAGCARGWYMTTEDGYEQQFALNVLAGFSLTRRLLPLLEKAHGRVILTGSRSHNGIRVRWDDVMLSRRYNPLTAYKQSKLCCLLFAKGLNDRYAHRGIRAYTVDPGLVRTDIGNKDTGGLVSLVWTMRKRGGASPEIPARTYLYLCQAQPAPEGLNYFRCRERGYSGQVTSENADRLFALGERLCGVQYDKRAEV